MASGKTSLRALLAGLVLGGALLAALAFAARSVPLGAVLAGGGVPLLLASVYRLLPLALNTLSWHALLPGTARLPFGRMLRLRWIGESINQLLPVAQIGGDFARARLLAHGASRARTRPPPWSPTSPSGPAPRSCSR